MDLNFIFKQLAVPALPSQKGTVGLCELRGRSRDSEAPGDPAVAWGGVCPPCACPAPWGTQI